MVLLTFHWYGFLNDAQGPIVYLFGMIASNVSLKFIYV